MKTKYFIFSFIFSLFCFCSVVNADTNDIQLTNFYSSFDNYINEVNNSSFTDIDTLFNYYNQNYSSTCPYFYLGRYTQYRPSHPYELYCFISLPSFDIALLDDNAISFMSSFSGYYIMINNNDIIEASPLNNATDDYFLINLYSTSVGALRPISTNFSFSINHFYVYDNGSLSLTSDRNLFFPSFNSSVSDVSLDAFSITSGNSFPTYEVLYDGSYNPSVGYTEINLNNYSYVALSLKNYNTEPFDTIFQVKGQLCLTPVYNYGMKEKTEYYSGYQVDRCSPVYDDFTPTRVYILDADIQNNAIYYLKAYDTSIDNIIKVSSNVFDITPITSENANNPNVIIGGRSYPTIPYNDLSSSSTISEEEGYISGESKNVFDISSDSNFVESLFSNPLQTLGNVWTSIITMFALVGSFIALLPTTLQTFLIAGFSIAIVLGILKILL